MAPDVSETEDGIEAQIDSVLQQRDLNWIDILNDLIVKLLNIGNRTNSLQYLNRVIAKIEEIVQDIGDNEVDNKMLNNLGSALLMRYERTADVKDLEKAISHVAEAIENTLPSDPDLARRMSNLNKMRLQQYRRTANMDYLEAAIFGARETIENALVGPLDRVFLLADLSTALSQQYEQTHNEGTLNEAISLAIEAIRLTAQHIVDGENDSKSNVEDLKESISIIQKSITPLSKQSEQSEWVRRLSNLGSLLYLRYERRHDPSDLNDAISTMGIAKSLTAQDHPDSNSLLNNLGAILFSKYETTREMSDLLEAISKASEAVKATPNSHPDLPGRLSNLSNMLFKQYEVTFDLDHLKTAISKASEAVDTTLMKFHSDFQTAFDSRDGITRPSFKRTFSGVWNTIHPKKSAVLATRLSSLSSMLRELYDKTSVMGYLDKAISTARDAVRATPHRDSELASRLDGLVKMLLQRYEKMKDIKDRDEAGTLAIEREDLDDNHHADC